MERSLQVVAEQLQAATRAAKCHSCGCLHQTVAALEHAGMGDIAAELAAARATFTPKTYDCLGCAVCHPAIAANAFTEAFPDAGAGMDLCPTKPPVEREGWPPLPGDYTVVRFRAPVAACTLHTAELARELASVAPEGLAIAGTLVTENLGIERIIKNVLANESIRVLVLCGEDGEQAVGHLPGQSLASLFEHGVDARGRIRGAKGKRPTLKNVTTDEVEAFRRRVRLVSMIGEHDASAIAAEIRNHASESAADGVAPAAARIEVVSAGEPKRLIPDPAGYFVVYPDASRGVVSVEHYTNDGVLDLIVEGLTATSIYATIVERRLLSRLDHAAYLGRELARAERSLVTGERYVQDRAPGELLPEACGCSKGCGS